MKNEKIGTIIYEDKMVDLDKTDIKKLEKMSEDLKAREINLKQKVESVFKQ